jgi:hypothetical protein
MTNAGRFEVLRDLGLTLGEILDFEELAADCAADGVYEFFRAPALPFTNGGGTPSTRSQ